MASPTKGVTLRGWPKGLDNRAQGVAVPTECLRDALNVDLDSSGKPRRRAGRTKVLAGVRAHSLHNAACGLVYAEGDDLRVLNTADYSTTSLRTLTNSDRISYEDLNGVTYASNGRDFIVIRQDGSVADNGVAGPGGQPIAAPNTSFGAMRPGSYLVAVTFVSSTGEESGAAAATACTLESSGSIDLTSIPQGSAAGVRIYCSEPGGERLREAATVPMGVTAYTLTGLALGKDLDTQFMERLPAGRIIRQHAGRMCSVVGPTVAYSEPMRYGLYRPDAGFFQFERDVTVFEPVADGIFVVADQAYFLRGTDFASMSREALGGSEGIFGTGMRVRSSLFGAESGQEAAYWYSTAGAVVGFPGGTIRHLTEEHVALPSYDEGASVLRDVNGMRHAVTAFRGTGASSTSSVGDSIDITVRRNGVLL